MIRAIKPVRIGILIGLFGIVFGVGWAVYLVIGHEQIHETLETISAKVGQDAYVKAEGHGAEGLEVEITQEKKVHVHKDGSSHMHGQTSLIQPQEKEDESMGDRHHAALGSPPEENKGHESMQGMQAMMQGGHHNNPVIAMAHTRLVRGHLHAMGLGLVTIVISLILAFTTIGKTTKSAASILTGLGGIIYPISWIVMGYLTPALGPEGAEASVIYIAGPGVGFVLFGIFVTVFALSRDIIKNKD